MVLCPALLFLLMFLFVPDDIDTPAAFIIESFALLVLSVPFGAISGATVSLLVIYVRKKI